ncbi:MAG: nucleoside transporter C-terminal domain-containing protein [Verrucomicrobiota bacterium]
MALKVLSLFGLAVMVALAWACSMNRKQFPWRTVLSGLALQFFFALIILKTDFGRAAFDLAQRAVARLISFANEGSQLVFGPLGKPDVVGQKLGVENGPILAIIVTATIILVSALSSLLYHWNILPRVVQAMAWVMQRVMRTSGSESLAAAANIFMGQTEAPLVIKPYLLRMTRSELLALMTGGMATIAGGVLAIYVSFGEAVGRMDMAGHLLTASVMSAPAALLIAKVMLPETEPSETAGGASAQVGRTSQNSIDALCRGASDGMKLSLNVMAMLIAFVAIVALANYLLGLPQRKLGVTDPITFQNIFGWVNAPFAWFMGVPAKDCLAVGQILGERIVINEFIGYLSLAKQQGTLDPRSFTIATYALCGFANFGSIAIQIGGIGTLVPERRADLAKLGVRSMIGGLLACYLTATIVGILI